MMENFNWTPIWIMLAWIILYPMIVLIARFKQEGKGLSEVDKNIEEIRQAQKKRG